MVDIVDRLNSLVSYLNQDQTALKTAIEEIEKLRKEVRSLSSKLEGTQGGYDYSLVSRMTHEKTHSVLDREGYKITGFVITHVSGDKCISDLGAVRWQTGEDFYKMMHKIMHPNNSYVYDVPDKCDRIVWRGKYYHLPIKQEEPKNPDAFDISLLIAASKSGDEGAMRLAAQLAGVPPCDDCGYRKEYCRCGNTMKVDGVLKLAKTALESCVAGDYSTGHVIGPNFDEHLVVEAEEAIDQYLKCRGQHHGK